MTAIVTAHVFPSFELAVAQKKVNVTTDTIQALLVATGTYTWNATALAAVTVHDFLTANGTLTEVAGGASNYTRQTLATVGISDTVSAPAGYTTLTCSGNPTWTNCTFTCLYALFFDNTVGGTDTTNQVIAYWDLGGVQAATPATPFVLTLGTLNGVSQALIQWQSS